MTNDYHPKYYFKDDLILLQAAFKRSNLENRPEIALR